MPASRTLSLAFVCLLGWLVCPHSVRAEVTLLGELADAAVVTSWTGTYPAGVTNDAMGTGWAALKLPARFSKSGDRCYWDRQLDQPVDLTPYPFIQLALGTDNEIAVKERSVALGVADVADPTRIIGWYVAFLPETPAGLLPFVLTRGDFRVEGDVPEDGWSRIARVRISLWAGMNEVESDTFVADFSSRSLPSKQFLPTTRFEPLPEPFAELPLVPWPASVRPGEGALPLTGRTLELVVSGGDAARRAAELVASQMLATPGIELRIAHRDAPDLSIMSGEAPAASAVESAEAYALHVTPGGLRLDAGDEAGLYYGLQTLAQLVRERGDRLEIPSVLIIDRPALRVRGMYLHWLNNDAGFATAKRVIAALSRLKINTVFIDVGAQMQYETRAFPVTGANAFSKEQMRELVEFARRHHIDLCPYYQLYGHSNWIGNEPGWRHLMERPDHISWYSSWNWQLPETRAFARDILREAAEVFEPKFIHLGHDEIEFTDIGASSETRGMPREQLIADSMNELGAFVTSLGPTPIVWGDTFINDFPRQPASEQMNGALIASSIRAPLVVNGWLYSADEELHRRHLELFRTYGFRTDALLFSPWTDAANIRLTARLMQEYGGLGMVGTLWHAWGAFSNFPENVANTCLGAMALNAHFGWNPDGPVLGYAQIDWNQRLMELIDPVAVVRGSPDHVDHPLALPASMADDATRERVGALVRVALPTRLAGDGVAFDVVPAPVVMKGDDGDGMPEQVSVAVGRRVHAMHLLHALSSPYDEQRWLVPDRLQSKPQVAAYRVVYEDGEVAEIPVRYRHNAMPWNAPVGANASRVAWQGSDARGRLVRLHHAAWVNPRPEATVARVDVVGGTESGMNLMVFGITVEEAP
jgi:hypothetical protein